MLLIFNFGLGFLPRSFLFEGQNEIIIFNHMKKYILILMVAATLAVTSCGSGSTTTEATDPTVDSTAVKVDSTAKPATGTSGTPATPESK